MPQVVTFLGAATWVARAVQVVLFVASIAYSRQQSKKLKKALKRTSDINSEAQDRSFTAKDPAGPRRIIYGETRVGGNIVFIHTNGTNNQYLHLVIAMAGHEVTSFSSLQFDDEVVPLNGAGEATGRYAGHVDAQFFLGSPSQISNAALQANCPEVWTSNHRLRGIAGVYVRLKYNPDLFPNAIPNITAVCRGKKVFDPRSGLTAWSRNAALIMADYMCDQKLGMGLDYESQINEAGLIASANNCDELIEKEDATFEPRYTINGSITTDTVHFDVLEDMADAMAGKYVEVGGRWSINSGYYRTPTLTFDENSLRGGLSVQTKISRAENFNAVKGTFISPENFWQPADYPPVTNSTYESQDQNIRIFRDFQFPFTTSSATCQRLGKIFLEKVRQPITVQVKGNLSWLQAHAGDVVNFTNARFGWSAKPFEIVDLEIVVDADEVGVDAVLRETASGVYDWADGEETTVDLAPNTDLPDPFFIGAPSAVTVLADNSTREEVLSGDFVPRIKVNWTAPADEFVLRAGLIRVQYKKVTGSTWHDVVPVPGSQTELFIQNPVESTSYHVRIRSENRRGLVSSWIYSDPTVSSGDTTPPAAPTGFTASGAIGGIVLEWTNPGDTDFDRTEIYEHTATTPAPTAGSVALTTVSGPTDTYFRGGLSGGAVRFYWIRSVDTSGNKSAWVGPQGATVATELSATAIPGSAYGFDSSASATPTSSTVTATVSGGIPTFAYAWEYVSGNTGISVSDSTAATVSFTGGGGGTGSVFAVWRCKVTDSAASEAYTQEVDIELENGTDP